MNLAYRKIIYFPIIASFLGHGLFFSVFKWQTPRERLISLPKLYLISASQLLHETAKRIELTPLTLSLQEKNPLWADLLQVRKKINDISAASKIEVIEPDSLELEQDYFVNEFPAGRQMDDFKPAKILPKFNELFYYRLPSDIKTSRGENIISFGKGMQLSYYVQGPVSDRSFQASDFMLEMEKVPLELKLRFWVTKNGRVNQVIIEEGSGFPIIDKKLADTLKKWRFKPKYAPTVPKYQWGVIKIRVGASRQYNKQ